MLYQGRCHCGAVAFEVDMIEHRFCPTRGIHPYGEGVDPKGNAIAAINLRCVDGVDLDQVPVQHYNGADY